MSSLFIALIQSSHFLHGDGEGGDRVGSGGVQIDVYLSVPHGIHFASTAVFATALDVFKLMAHRKVQFQCFAGSHFFDRFENHLSVS